MRDTPLIDELKAIIAEQTVEIEFQPVFCLASRKVRGYEALSRGPEGSALRTPARLFGLAGQIGLLSELELVCRKQAILRFVELSLDGQLFLNVSPQVLLDDHHPRGETMQLLEQIGLSASWVVIELTEHQQVDAAVLKQAIEHYRGVGFTIAIDDFGAGYSGLQQWSELQPDIVKVDRYFVHDCHLDVVKQEFLKFILSLASVTGAEVIAEGIEHPDELAVLLSLGFSLTQGYLLQKPTPQPARALPVAITRLLPEPPLKVLVG